MTHTLINDLIALLMEVPPDLAAKWGLWFTVGLILSMWTRREKVRLVVHGPGPRQKSGVRPPSGVRVVRPAKPNAAPSAGDAFGDLEALLDTPEGAHRRPGEALS